MIIFILICCCSAQFPSFKADPTFPWEIKRHLTVLSFQQSLDGQRDNKIGLPSFSRMLHSFPPLNVLYSGPSTLRKSTAPLSALQLSEIARTHTLSTRYRGALNGYGPFFYFIKIPLFLDSYLVDFTLFAGRTDGQIISLDISQLQLVDENGSLDISNLLKLSQQSDNGHQSHPSNRNAALGPTSTYLPSRPEDWSSFQSSSLPHAGSEEGTKSVTVTGAEISRPDLIGASKTNDKKSAKDRSSVNANNTNGHSNPAGGSGTDGLRDSISNPPPGHAAGPRASESEDADRWSLSGTSSVSTFKKMTNFFSRKS